MKWKIFWYVQIYNEKVLDLLNDTGAKGPGLRLRWNQQRGFYAENLYVVEVETVEDALRVFHTGLRGKVMALPLLLSYTIQRQMYRLVLRPNLFRNIPLRMLVLQRHLVLLLLMPI